MSVLCPRRHGFKLFSCEEDYSVQDARGKKTDEASKLKKHRARSKNTRVVTCMHPAVNDVTSHFCLFYIGKLNLFPSCFIPNLKDFSTVLSLIGSFAEPCIMYSCDTKVPPSLFKVVAFLSFLWPYAWKWDVGQPEMESKCDANIFYVLVSKRKIVPKKIFIYETFPQQ